MLKGMLSRRADEARKRQMGRLPPGQSLTQKFPVLHVGRTFTYNSLDDWDFKLFGAIEQEQQLSWSDFKALPRTKLTMDIHCVTRWSKFDTVWEGVTLNTLMDAGLLKLRPAARFVVQHCEQGYTTNLPLALMLQENVLLADTFAGQPLTAEHGFPLRVVIGSRPGLDDEKDAYFWKGGKWLRGLEFVNADRLGFWEKGGYHNEADPWREQRFARQGP